MSARSSESPLPSRARALGPGLAATALVVVLLALYARTRTHGFVAYDDPVYVSENPVVARGLTWEGLRWAFGFHAGNWHPLTWLAHMLDVELFGLDAGAHHLVNAGLHALNAVLLFLALARLTGARWSALAVAALWALSPLRAESVAWASEKKDVLAGTFWCLTLLAHERHARRGGAGRYALVCLTLALGLMAKSMLVTLPLVLLVLDAWPLGRAARAGPGAPSPWPRLVLEKLPLLALALGAGLATLLIQSEEGALGSLSLLERATNAGRSAWIYVGQTFLPGELACFVPHPVLVTPRAELGRALFLPGTLGLLGIAAVTALFLRLRAGRPHLLVGWLWFLLALLPVIGLVQVGHQAHADRYTYLPTVGLLLALVLELRARVAARPAHAPVLAAGLAALALFFALRTRPQIDTWRDSRTLFQHALAANPRNYLAATFLGQVERRAGELAAARGHLELALEANKLHVPAMLELGLTLLELGDLPEARKLLKRTLRNDPGNAAAQRALAEVERRLGPGPGD
ncbi:MAG TPA: tetratricopeptide repeat protein [Planctomycetota bacterium]